MKCNWDITSLCILHKTNSQLYWSSKVPSKIEMTISVDNSKWIQHTKLDLQSWVESEIFDFSDYGKQCLHLLFVGLRCDISDLNNPRLLFQFVRSNRSQCIEFSDLPMRSHCCCCYCWYFPSFFKTLNLFTDFQLPSCYFSINLPNLPLHELTLLQHHCQMDLKKCRFIMIDIIPSR